MAIGSLLRSNGAAIGVALGFALGGSVITALAANYISETASSYLLPYATPIVASLEGDSHISLGVAFVVVAVWLVAFLAAGLVRTLRDEY